MARPQVLSSPVGEGTRWTGAQMACMIMTEINQVMAVMRQNAHWAVVPRNQDEDLDEGFFLLEFRILRREIFSWQDWPTVKPMNYLAPFLGLIGSNETSASVTGVALSAVYKILTNEIFDKETVEAAEAMHLIVDAVTGCEFEASDPASEELVLLIGQVLLACLKCRAGPLLSDADVISIINTGLRMAFAKGKLLRRTRCQMMQDIVRTIFARLHELEPTEDDFPRADIAAELDSAVTSLGEVTAPAPAKGSSICFGIDRSANSTAPRTPPSPVRSRSEPSDGPEGTSETAASNQLGSAPERAAASEENGDGPQKLPTAAASLQSSPSGLPCLVEVFQLLCKLIVPEGKLQYESEDRILFGLALLSAAVEVAGGSFEKHPRILALVTDGLFGNLMQAGQSSNLLVLSLVSGIVLALYQHLKHHLKLQMAAFFEFVVLRAAQGGNHQQEAALQILQDFCRQPCFITDMFANADGDITCRNTFENLSNLLSTKAFSDIAPLSPLNLLSLEGLLAVIQRMADRADGASVSGSSSPDYNLEEFPPFWNLKCDTYEDPAVWVEFLRRQKYVKRRLMLGAEHFNRDPDRGLEFLQNVHLLPEKLDAASVAFFLFLTPGLDKDVLGEYLSAPEAFNISVLGSFTKEFNFTGMPLDTALRTYLEAFRLPGVEAEKISRVLDAFASRYYAQCPQSFAHEDAVSALSHSILMLNSDQHNEQVTQKTTEEDFIRSNRGFNVGKDLPREMLTQLYRSIAKDEIRVSSESLAAEPGMTYSRWLDLLRRSQATTPFLSCDPTNPLLDRDMFSVIWGPSIAAISAVFDHAEKADTLQQCVAGFLAVAKISAAHQMRDVLDNLVVSLCKFITPAGSEKPATENNKARMAASAVSEIVNQHGDMIRSGRRRSIDSVLRLHKLGPPSTRNELGVQSTSNELSQDGHDQPSDGREGLSILANAAAAAAADVQAESGRRKNADSIDTRDREQGSIDAQSGSARSSPKTSPPKARGTKALNPNTQAYVPPSRRSSGSQNTPSAKLSNLVETKPQIQSKIQTQTLSPISTQTPTQTETHTQARPTVEVPEPSKSALSANSPSWQPPSKLAASAFKGLALGRAHNSLSKSLSIPSADARKKDTAWDVQLPDGFMEAAVSPLGTSNSAFEPLDSEGEGAEAEGEGAEAVAEIANAPINGLDGADPGEDDPPGSLDGLAADDMSQLDAVLDTVPGFSFISDDEGDGEHAEPKGSGHENGSELRPASRDGAREDSNGTPLEQETGDGRLAGAGDETGKETQPESSGQQASEEEEVKGKEKAVTKAREGRETIEAERRLAGTAGPTWRQEAKAPEPLEWRKRQTVPSSRWRDDKHWNAPVDPRKPFGLEANPTNAGTAGGASRGVSVSQQVSQPIGKPQQPPEVRERLPAGKPPGNSSPRLQVPKAPTSRLARVSTPPSETGPAGRQARPHNAGALVPPGFSKTLLAAERAPPAVASSEPVSSTRTVVFDSEPRSSSSLADALISKPGVPSRLVLTRVLVKRTVVQEGPTLGPPAEAPVCQDAEVRVDKRTQLDLLPVGELGSGPNGRLQDLPSWLGRPVDISDGPKGFFEAVPKVSEDTLRPVPKSSGTERRSAIAEDPASAAAPQGDTWRIGDGGRQEQQPRRVPRIPSGEGDTDRKVLRTPVTLPPPPPSVHPQEVLRRLLPQAAIQPLTFSSSNPEPVAQVTHKPRSDSSPHFAAPNPAGNSDAWVPDSHWAPQDSSRPPMSSSFAQVPARIGQAPNQTFNHWPGTNYNHNPPQGAPPPGLSGWPGEVNSFRAVQHPAVQGNGVNDPHPFQEHPFLSVPPGHPQSGYGFPPPTSVPQTQAPPLSALQNAPHIRALQATVQEQFSQWTGGLKSPGEPPSPASQPAEFPPFGAAYKPGSPTERSGSGGRDGTGARWDNNAASGYRPQAPLPHFDQEDLAFRGPELGRNYSGGYEYMVSQAPLPLSSAGSMRPRERPTPHTSQSQYDNQRGYAHNPLATPESTREEAEETMVLPPEFLPSRPSMSPELLPAERSPRDGNAANRAPEKNGAYNPLQWQAAQQERAKPKEDSVSDADLQRFLDDSAVLDASPSDAGEPVESRGWASAAQDRGPWQNVGTAESLNRSSSGREAERWNEPALAAQTAPRAGVNGVARTAAQILAGRPDEEQFEADTKAAMDVSLEEFRAQGASQHPAAQTKSWPSVRVAATPMPAVGKGLANRTGEYNCFLNVIIQSLWHLIPFRRCVIFHPPKRLPSEAPLCVRRQAVLRGLQGIFRALSADDGKPTAVDPSALRTALHNAHKGSDLFQMEEMNDASEVLLSIFGCLHEGLQAPVAASPPNHADGLLPTPSNGAASRNKAADVCGGSCFVHELFGLDMVEFTYCGLCNKRTHELHYQQYFHLVNCSALSDVAVQSPGRPFAPLLRRVLDGSTPLRPCDKDEGGCGEPLPTTHVLDKAPQLFTVVLVWGSAEASQSQVRSVVDAISTQIRVSEIFPNLEHRGQHALRCVVCYYGLHYFAFAYSTKAQQWLLLDDTHVKVVGPWEKVVEQCTNGRLQPSVLFYQSY